METLEELTEIATIGFNRNFKTTDLNSYLINSEKEITYDHHSNGFYLKNNDIRVSYVVRSFGGENTIELWFLKTNPKFCFSSDCTNMKKIPRSLNCDFICLSIGNTYSFSFPIDERVVEDTIDINKRLGDIDPYPRNPPKIEQEWFNEGTLLLKKAAEKYDLKKFYKKFERDFLKVDNRSFFEKIGLNFS